MALYERKPPVFNALQFTGGVESAKQIIEGLAVVAPSWSARFLPASSEFGLEAGEIVETQFPDRLRIFNTDGEEMSVVSSMWVTVSSDEIVTAISNAEFESKFQLH